MKECKQQNYTKYPRVTNGFYECIKEVELIKEKNKKWEEELEENTKKNAENTACKNCASAKPIETSVGQNNIHSRPQ